MEHSNDKEKGVPRKRKPYSITHDTLIDQLFTAYFDARCSKRGTKIQLLFELDFEHNLLVLAREIEKGTYEVGRSVCFITNKPVKREIFAADFRDRVVHHLLYNWLSPMFERSFITDSYSCRNGKGTLYGIKRTHKHMRQCTQNFTQPAYVLKVDISGYFMSINRQRLLTVVIAEMEKYGWLYTTSKSPFKSLINNVIATFFRFLYFICTFIVQKVVACLLVILPPNYLVTSIYPRLII